MKPCLAKLVLMSSDKTVPRVSAVFYGVILIMIRLDGRRFFKIKSVCIIRQNLNKKHSRIFPTKIVNPIRRLGETTMIRTAREPNCLKVSAISSIVNREVLQPFVFRNYTLPFRIQSLYNGTFKHKMWEAARASSAAPGYFGEFKLGENIHQDGGLFVNNPCAVAIHEAKCIWPNAKLLSVVSIGTGRCQPLDLASSSLSTAAESTATSWKQKLSKVIDSATDTERVHTVLHDLLPPKVYYRFNPYLSELHGLDETDPVRWQRMLDDVEMYIRKNQSKMNEAAKYSTI